MAYATIHAILLIILKLDMFYVIVLLQMIEIRRNLFQSADFKLTNTELKGHIKAMVTLLEEPTQLKNDTQAIQAIQQLHKVKQTKNWDKTEVDEVTYVERCSSVLNYILLFS